MLLGGCDREPPRAVTPGARLEAAAIAQGLVVDPAAATLAGSWARDTDRMCIVGPERDEQRIGVSIDYGEGQWCSASGSVRRIGESLRVTLGPACRFKAKFEGDQIIFPVELPAGCSDRCVGRASLAALDVERLSSSTSEARMLRDRAGHGLCLSS